MRFTFPLTSPPACVYTYSLYAGPGDPTNVEPLTVAANTGDRVIPPAPNLLA